MKAEKTEAFVPTEVLDSWNTMDVNEKVNLLTKPSSETIEALTKFLEEFDKPSKRVSDLRKDRNDALIGLLKKDDRPFGETLAIINLIDKGIAEATEDKDKDNNVKVKALLIAGGIISIVAGGACYAKLDKNAGKALIAAGSAALLGSAGVDTKIGKLLIESFSDDSEENIIEA